MAITWTVDINALDIPAKRVRITVTRTDDTPTPDDVRTYSAATILAQKDGETLAQMRDRIAAEFYGMYTAEIVQEANVAEVVSTYETALATALDGLET